MVEACEVDPPQAGAESSCGVTAEVLPNMADSTLQPGSEAPDEELARQCQAGSLAAFEALVLRHQHAVYRFLLGSTGQEADAWDLTQAAWVAAHQAIQRYRPAQPFLPWLFTIARRKFLDHCRSARRRTGMESVSEVGTLEDPSLELASREDRDQLWARVRRLVSTDQFTALWLHYGQDLSVQDIARVLGRTQTSVKVILFRARRILMRHFQADLAMNHEESTAASVWRVSRSAQPLTGKNP